jgi:hypothetical protein
MDENPGLIAPYLKEHQLSLIVLPAYSYVNDTLKVFGIPQNWIVDSHGVVRLKGTGYDSTEKWELRMADAIERVTAARRSESGISDVNSIHR